MSESFDMGQALSTAMEAEARAETFYREGASKAGSPRGKDFLTQLADFEHGHYEKLRELRDSLADGQGFVPYEGLSFQAPSAPAEPSHEVQGVLEELLEILRVAMEAETKACELYRTMAEGTDDRTGKAMFNRFADEEVLHRRILADEFYHLNNQGGVWTWGD